MVEGPLVSIDVRCHACGHKRVVAHKLDDEACYRAECTKMQVVIALKLKHLNESPKTPAHCPYVSTSLRVAMVEQQMKEDAQRRPYAQEKADVRQTELEKEP